MPFTTSITSPRRARAQLANAVKCRDRHEPEGVELARTELATANIAAYVRIVVDRTPPLSEDQRARLSAFDSGQRCSRRRYGVTTRRERDGVTQWADRSGSARTCLDEALSTGRNESNCNILRREAHAMTELLEAQDSSRLLYTVPDCVRLLQIGRSTIFELLASGELRSVRIRGLRRIPASAIDEFVNNLSNRGAA